MRLLADEGITYPQGYRAAAVHCGIRKKALDLALIVSDRPAVAAGLFTRNRCCAAPVIVARRHLGSKSVRGILVNSGNANAATGAAGIHAAERCLKETARRLGCAPAQLLVASTGIIGVPLPVERIIDALDELVANLSPANGARAAEAIMTTDTFPKQRACSVALRGGTVRLGGIAKGAGMIMPNMATMLAFITCDAQIGRTRWQRILRQAVQLSFNRITVDGDTSTNDCVFGLANGASGVAVDREEEHTLYKALEALCIELAQLIVRDGEGATKFVTVVVEGCRRVREADAIARTVANSPLVKTALTGCNPNWGRVIAAAGRAGVAFDPDRLDVYFNDVLTVKNGCAAGVSKAVLDELFKQKEITIRIVLHEGRASATIWTTDLSHEYVNINVAYS
ncbi:MAG: bifunctional glutamate N-acetyltransferase/amino-acid acetyltransferase ArgJ [bacterium]|nr:bifunctional glutamate N-acetyltransferase/amino-acid acetyltransferase ArgJ [bacterium]